jgi:hypothetical protein
VVASVLLGAAFLGTRPSIYWLVLLLAGISAIVLAQRPILGLPALLFTALFVPIEFGTGSAVALNPATLLIPAMLGVWILDMMRRREVRLVASPTNRPLMLFLLSGLFSLLIGNAYWDPAVPREGDFIIVQLAQWAIFVFSAGVFWLTGNLVRDEIWLRRLTFIFLALGGSIVLLTVLPGGISLVLRWATFAAFRAPFWMLLTALAGGQLLFNQKLSTGWRLFLLATLVAVAIFAFFLERKAAAYWIGAAAVVGTLAWLRFPRLRWFAVILLLVLAVTGTLSSTIYDFAGGDAEWDESGGSRLTLIGRVVEVAMHNPITGLGPAAYRRYAATKPLAYGRALWLEPQINSHNNYVDLFAHVGLLGLCLFFWFAAELIKVGLRLRKRFTHGFLAGYVNAMLAAWAAALVLMLILDWILPFVYNVGFQGFQASLLVWLFLGGLVALDFMTFREEPMKVDHAA